LIWKCRARQLPKIALSIIESKELLSEAEKSPGIKLDEFPSEEGTLNKKEEAKCIVKYSP